MHLDEIGTEPYYSPRLSLSFRFGDLGNMSNCAKLIIAILLLITASGCAPAPSRQITGTWRLDAGSAAFGLLDKANIQVVLAPDGTLTVSSEAPIVGSVSRTGTWKLISSNENVVNVAYQWNEQDKPTVLVITVIDSDTIRLIPPLGPIKAEVPFKRIANDAATPSGES